MGSEVIALVIAIVGVIGTLAASIASQVLGTRARREEFANERLRDREAYDRDQAKDRLAAQRAIIVEFILATDDAHSRLRAVATQSPPPADLSWAAGSVVREAGLYAIRERLLVSIPPELVYAAEQAFHSVIEIRDAIRKTARSDSPAYRDAYDVYADAIWQLRQKARESFAVAALDLGEVRRIEAERLTEGG